MKNGDSTRIAYIPQKYAKVGLTLKLKINGEWEDGWIVTEKFRSVKTLPNIRKMLKDHENSTGDSLPKRRA